MLCYVARRVFCRGALVCGVFFISMVLSPGTVQAAGAKDLQNLQLQITKTVDRSRGLARAVLTRLKEIDTAYRTADGRPLPGQAAAARQDLGRIQTLHESFVTTAGRADFLIGEFGKTYKSIQAPGSRENELRSAVDRLGADLQKYKQYVDQFFGRAQRDFGTPAAPAVTYTAPRAGVRPTPGLRITGEFGGVAGTSSYKQPNAAPAVDRSSSNIGLRVAGVLAPSARTQFPFQLSHENKIEQKKIGLTKLGAGVRHAANENLDLTANLDYSGYADKDDKILSFGDFIVAAGTAYHTDRLRLNLNLRRLSRSYGDNKNANYATLQLQPDVVMRAGGGTVAAGLKLFNKSNEIEALDHKEFSPFFRWEFAPGGSALNVQYQQITHPNVDDSPQDNNRLKAGLLMRKSGPAGKRSYGPDVAMYSYPHAEENDYLEFGFAYDGQTFGEKTSLSSLRLAYRMYSDTMQFDFAQATFRRNKRAAGSGFGWEMNLAGRYYTESSDEDDPLRFSNVHEPHTLDYYHRLGWTIARAGVLQEVTFGPLFGGKFYMDTERNDAFENDVNYVWANPRNTVLGGVHVLARVLATPAFRIGARLQWRTDFLYNADPTRKFNTTDLELTGNYQVNPRLFLDFDAKLHTTRADIESETDLEKSAITAHIRYLFDVVR